MQWTRLRLPFAWPIDGFVTSMLVAIVIALIWPSLGSDDGLLKLGAVTNWGVALLFFLNGATLSLDRIVEGARNWRLHLLVQLSTYVMFPLLAMLVVWLIGDQLPADLALGVLYLGALSSAISSSVAMTAVARGNVPAAVCSATLSTLLGLVLTPLWLGAFLHASGHHLPLAAAMRDVALHLLLPFAVGQLLRPLLRNLLSRHAAVTNKLDKLVIVLIVFNAFADSTQAGVWKANGLAVVAETLGLAGALLAAMLVVVTAIARRIGFTPADEIAAVFCGSKKSVSNGIPMAALLLGGSHSLGLVVLPVMLYHQLQLIVCAVIARRYASRAARVAVATPA